MMRILLIILCFVIQSNLEVIAMKRVRTTGMKLVNMKSEVKDLGGLKKVVAGLKIHEDTDLASRLNTNEKVVSMDKLRDSQILDTVRILKRKLNTEDIPEQTMIQLYWGIRYESELNNLLYHFEKHGKSLGATNLKHYFNMSIKFRDDILNFRLEQDKLKIIHKDFGKAAKYVYNGPKSVFIIMDKESGKIYSFGENEKHKL